MRLWTHGVHSERVQQHDCLHVNLFQCVESSKNKEKQNKKHPVKAGKSTKVFALSIKVIPSSAEHLFQGVMY